MKSARNPVVVRISGGGNFLSPRNEGLENGTAKPCHSEARSAVRIALPQPLADMNFSEESIQALTTMRSSRRFAPQDDMSEVESNKNTSLALGERVSAGQERGQSETLTTMRSSRVPSRGMSEAKGEQESTETLSFRCDCERCRFMRGRKGRFAPQDDMVLKNLVVEFYRELRSNNCFGA